MKKVLILLALTISTCLFAQTGNSPFAKYGYDKQIMYTSSKGEFEEFHDQTDVVEIGTALFDTRTNKFVGFISEEQEKNEVAAAISAMAPDPLCEKYYWISPYAFCNNNPVNMVDPDGRIPIPLILWAAYEIGSAVYDGYQAYKSLSSNSASTAEKVAAVGGLAVGVFLPGGGYGTAGKAAVNVVETTVDAARAVDRVNDTRKATNMAENAAKGKAFENKVGESLGNNKASQVTIEAADGTRTKVDFAQKTDGKVTLTEAKSSQTAPLTKNQQSAHPQIENSGGTVRGNKGAEIGLPAGEKIPPTKIEIIRPEELFKLK